MRNFITAIAALLIISNASAQNFEDLIFGSDSTLDVVTWNIEHFPKNGNTTMDYVAEIILAMDVDVVAMQEVEDVDAFEDFIADLDGYEGYVGNHEYARLGYIYKTSEIEVNEIYEIFAGSGRAYPRPPLVMELTYNGEEVVIYNNHYKCCGNGTLDESDLYDEEKRRLDASEGLYQNINFYFDDKPVLLVGDLNDILTDSPANNVFNIFLEDPENYFFADMFIAEGDDDNWSYPSWPSHLDHILITNEIFEDDAVFSYDCDIIKLGDYMSGGFDAYDNAISDHLPVGINLFPSSTSVGLSEISKAGVQISNYPNPSYNETSIIIDGLEKQGFVEISDITGQKVTEFKVTQQSPVVKWNTRQQNAGIYFAKLIVDGQPISVRKIVVLK